MNNWVLFLTLSIIILALGAVHYTLFWLYVRAFGWIRFGKI